MDRNLLGMQSIEDSLGSVRAYMRELDLALDSSEGSPEYILNAYVTLMNSAKVHIFDMKVDFGYAYNKKEHEDRIDRFQRYIAFLFDDGIRTVRRRGYPVLAEILLSMRKEVVPEV